MKVAVALFIVLFTIQHTVGQSIETTDTVSYARSLAWKKQFEDADQLLTAYNSYHAGLNSLQLHAQVLYWKKAYSRSMACYNDAIIRFPGSYALKFDYGRMLFELNHLNKAKILLNEVLAHDSSQAEAAKYLAYIDLWTGHLRPAGDKAKNILKKDAGNADALAILGQIKNYTTPYLLLNVGHESDDQPRTGNCYRIEAGQYRSWCWSPVLQAQINQYAINDSSYRSLWLQAANKISIGSKTSFQLAAGMFQHLLHSGGAYFTGRIGIMQKLGAFYSLEAAFEKKPYQYSIASVIKPVLAEDATIALNLNKNDKWLGKAGYQQQHFADTNNIHTAYAWLLFPVVTTKTFKLKAGYAFSYANSDKNNYVPKSPASVPAAALHSTLPGVYDPYFTQQRQVINALLASMSISFSTAVELSTRVSVGIYAHADNPSLTVERSRSNQTYINKSYATLSYTPVEWVNTLQVKLSPAFSIQCVYNYAQLLFYTRNQGSVQLKYNFIHDAAK
jgi:hypothetical protein